MGVVDPDLTLEQALFDDGVATVAGLDEVGRGAWAGPVSVGVVVLRADQPPAPAGIRDSKLLSRARREALGPRIMEWAPAAVGSASPLECDVLGMRAAVALAASRALAALALVPEVVIVDGPLDLLSAGEALDEHVAMHRWRSTPPRVVPVVKADQRCISVAAASVVAKVARDHEMAELASSFPAFGFDSNAGYPSPVHRRALAGYGVTSIHRRTWSFVDGLPLGSEDQ